MVSKSGTRRCSPCQDALAFYFKDRSNIRRGEFELPYNFVTLEKSAVGGCDLCRILYQALIYAELPGIDLQNSNALVRLSSDWTSLTVIIQSQCKDSRGRGIQVSNILWSKRPDLGPIGGNQYELWRPNARMKIDP
jgi:hypothetical protein